MASLFQSGKYFSINTYDTTLNWLHYIMFLSEVYTLQDNTTIDGQIISVDELVVRAQYFSLHAIKHSLVLETTTTAIEYNIFNAHNY